MAAISSSSSSSYSRLESLLMAAAGVPSGVAPPAAAASAVQHSAAPLHSRVEPEDEKKIHPALTTPLLAGATRSAGKSFGKAASLPPVLEATPTVRHRYRFACSTSGTYTITVGSLIGVCGGICTIANSKVQPWASTFRVRSLTIWPNAASSGNYTFVDWLSSASSGYVRDTAKMINIPDGVVVSTALRFVPPKMSLAGNWLNPVTLSTSSSVLGMTIKIGAILDLDIEFTLSNVSQAGNITVAAGTLGNVYYLALDGASSNKLVPQGLPTTA